MARSSQPAPQPMPKRKAHREPSRAELRSRATGKTNPVTVADVRSRNKTASGKKGETIGSRLFSSLFS